MYKQIITVMILSICVLICGCTTQTNEEQSNDNIIMNETNVIPTIIVETTMFMSNPTNVETTTIIQTQSPISTHTITYYNVTNNPLVDKLFVKKTGWGVSDCIMKQVFPEIVNNNEYGISNGNSNLTALSFEKLNGFITDYESGKSTGQSKLFSISKCEGIPLSDNTIWDYIEVYGRYVPRNAKPSDYQIDMTVHTVNGKNVVFTSNETLVIDQKITIQSFIPIRRIDMDRVTSVTVEFIRLTNV